MSNKFKIRKINLSLWRNIAIVAGTFSFIICMLVLVNYIQINRIDPVNTELINSLVQRLEENPSDTQLREQIREMDLLVRKAYFTNQWQVKAGGYLLLLGVIVTAIALQMFYAGKQKLPEVTEKEEENIVLFREKARKWIVVGGFVLVGITLLFAFLTHKELGNKFTEAALMADSNPTQVEDAENHIQDIARKSEGIEEHSEGELEEVQGTEDHPEGMLEEAQGTVDHSEGTDNKIEKTPKSTMADYPTKEMMENFPSFRGPEVMESDIKPISQPIGMEQAIKMYCGKCLFLFMPTILR